MSLENLPKRRLVYESDQTTFEDKVNTLSDAGYTMEHYGVDAGDADCPTFFSAVMKLKSEGDINLRELLDIMDIPIDKAVEGRPFGSPLVEKAVREGWAAVSLYSGKITVVRKKKEEK